MADIDPLKVLFFVLILGVPIWLIWRTVVDVTLARTRDCNRLTPCAFERYGEAYRARLNNLRFVTGASIEPELAMYMVGEDLVCEALREELRPHIAHLIAGIPEFDMHARAEIHNAMYRARRAMELVGRDPDSNRGQP